MGAGQSVEKKEEEKVGATAPAIAEKEEGTPPTMIGGRRKKGRKTRGRKTRKGKRHGRK